MTLKNFDLIIFDCDGTLVDTEKLYNTIAAELLTDIGLPEYTPEECFRQFSGQSWSVMLAKLEEKHGIRIDVSIVDRYIDEAKKRIETSLQPVPHVHEVLEHFMGKTKICVASNGERTMVLKSLKLTGLDPYFPNDHVFNKTQVVRPKPAPDLFWFAAEQMGVPPARCAVIEDSVAGVTAGVAAGMFTIGFYGTALDGPQHKYDQEEAGAHATANCLLSLKDILHS